MHWGIGRVGYRQPSPAIGRSVGVFVFAVSLGRLPRLLEFLNLPFGCHFRLPFFWLSLIGTLGTLNPLPFTPALYLPLLSLSPSLFFLLEAVDKGKQVSQVSHPPKNVDILQQTRLFWDASKCP